LPTRDTRSFILRLTAEFLVIVVGVLVALGVDSWSTSKRERAQEAEYLSRLLDDVQFDLQELAQVDSVSRIGADASRQLSEAPVVDSMSSSRVTSAVIVVQNVRLPDLSRSTFEELINSGQIELIRSDAVRRALASYHRLITELAGGWNTYAPDLRTWYAARIPRRVYQLYEQTDGCVRYPEQPVYSFPVVCDFNLDGWSSERLEADIKSQAGREVFRMAEHNYVTHAFFTHLLLDEARRLERVLIDAMSED
jgi:hypothetical protein